MIIFVMNLTSFNNWTIKRGIGFAEVFLSFLLLTIFIPRTGIVFSYILIVFFFAVLLFRFRSVPLRKYTYLSLTYTISMLMYFLYGPQSAAFWILVYVIISDSLFKKGLFQAIINGSAYSLSIFIVGSIFGADITDYWIKVLYFFLTHFILVVGVFYSSEFVSRRVKLREIFYIISWEAFYYTIAALTALIAFWVIRNPAIFNVSAFVAGFLLLRWFIRRISFDAIEGNIYKDLIKLQSKVMKRSLEETIKVVVSYLDQYVDWTGLNIGRIDYNEGKISVIYSTSEEVKEGVSVPIDEGVAGKCIREARPIIIRNVAASEEYIKLRSNVKSEMTLPLVSEGRVIGVLDIEHNLVGAFTEKEIEYAKFFAFQLSSALQTNISLQPLVSTSEELKGF
ncbi:GAF domain-containing protein, partial [candidate division WOR-3 bacterium]|nr:GAF domain-containing protein [candidate division WOR-3 bacterium]